MSKPLLNDPHIEDCGLPLVSIGVTTKDRPTGLSSTLQCLLAQTYQNIEIIVSQNAGGSPLIPLVVEKARLIRPDIRFFVQPDDLNMNGNFRFVLSQAKGRYFMWASDDDAWTDNYVKDAVALLESDPLAVMAMPQCCYISRVQAKADHFNTHLRESISLENSSAIGRLSDYIRERANPNIRFYGVFRRENLAAAKFPDGFGADQILLAQLAWQGTFRETGQGTFYYSVDGETLQGDKGYRESAGTNSRHRHIDFLVSLCATVLHMPGNLLHRIAAVGLVMYHLMSNQQIRLLLKSDLKSNLIPYKGA